MARILIIDDDEAVRESLEAVTAAAGHDVRTAPDGCQGVAQHAAFRADVVVTDMVMPNQDGLETIVELRRRDPGLPIIAMSGGGRPMSASFFRAAPRVGADRTLAKPFAGATLLAAIDDLLRARTSGDPPGAGPSLPESGYTQACGTSS